MTPNDDDLLNQFDAAPKFEPEIIEHARMGLYLFPVEALPKELETYVLEASQSINRDASVVAVPMLSVLGAAIGNTRALRLKSDWIEPPIVWSVVIAESGDTKSPGLDAAVDPVRRLQKEACRKYEGERKEYEEQLSQWDAQRKKGTKPQKPTLRHYLTTEPTIEAVAVRLMNEPRGILIENDELSGFFGSFDQYKQGKADASQWLKMYGARPIKVDRKHGEYPTIYIDRASVCITGTIQPNVLKRCLGSEHFENGMIQRFISVYPERRAREWRDQEISEAAKQTYERIIRKLYRLEFERNGEDPEPVLLKLSGEAQRRFIAFVNQNGRDQLETSGALDGAYSKFEGRAARLALIIHCVREASGEPVDPLRVDLQSMESAIVLIEWFKRETGRIYAMLKETKEERGLREAEEIIRRNGGRITSRELQRAKHLKVEQADLILLSLARAGHGRIEPPEPTGMRGAPKGMVFILYDAGDGDRIQNSFQESDLRHCHPNGTKK